MSKNIFTKAQQKILLRNHHVSRCSLKSITYSNAFKLSAVKQSQELGLSSNEIFRRAGFDIRILGRDKPKQCLKRWKKTYWIKGDQGLLVERRGGHDRLLKVSSGEIEANKVRRLEAEVAYLKAENDFLAKLRAKRRP
jgi:transposase-like protein